MKISFALVFLSFCFMLFERTVHGDGKPGVCPSVYPTFIGRCHKECTKDSECEGDQKCCHSGCWTSCRKPTPGESCNTSCIVGTICTVVNGTETCQDSSTGNSTQI